MKSQNCIPEESSKLKKKDIVYYAKIMPSFETFDICELCIRTIQDDWYVGVDKRDKHAYLFYEKDIGKTIFTDRKTALNVVKKAELNNKTVVSNETYYEEY